MKKVLLIVIDALTARTVNPAIVQGRLPNMAKLATAGSLTNGVAVFPSITPAATSSIITGRYPNHHGIVGAFWYLPEEKNVVYYSSDFWVVLKKGLGNLLDDFLVKLNEERLQADTLFRKLEQSGFSTASINYFVYHADVAHELNTPLLLSILAGRSVTETVHGPSILYLGDLIKSNPEDPVESIEAPSGIFHRYGFDDATTGQVLTALVKEDNLPDLTVAYFPDNDFECHSVGPENALETVEQVDSILGDVIEAFGGLEAMLDQTSIIITGDHAQTAIRADDSASIICEQVLTDFSIATAGFPMTADDDLLICPNLRAAQLYFNEPQSDMRDEVLAQLLTDTRVDQAMWACTTFEPDQMGFQVATLDRGMLHFWVGDSGPNTAKDAYGGVWSWQGDLGVVDAQVSADGTLSFGDYPNAFERIATILNLKWGGHLWLTAKSGYEFVVSNASLHRDGGSHGSLHAFDSIVPVLTAGLPLEIASQLPDQPRSVDIAPLCQAILGLEPDQAIGQSRIFPGINFGQAASRL